MTDPALALTLTVFMFAAAWGFIGWCATRDIGDDE